MTKVMEMLKSSPEHHIVYVSNEWAKQLIRLAFPEPIDFANMKIVRVDGLGSIYRIVANPITSTTRMLGSYITRYRQVELNWYFDAINMERTKIGYDPISNTCILGKTWPAYIEGYDYTEMEIN